MERNKDQEKKRKEINLKVKIKKDQPKSKKKREKRKKKRATRDVGRGMKKKRKPALHFSTPTRHARVGHFVVAVSPVRVLFSLFVCLVFSCCCSSSFSLVFVVVLRHFSCRGSWPMKTVGLLVFT